MSIEAILKGDIPEPTVAKISVHGIGSVEVHELSSMERFCYESDIQKLIDGEFTEEAHFNKWMPRILFGRDRKLKAAELKALKSGLSGSAEAEIFTTARSFPIESAIKK